MNKPHEAVLRVNPEWARLPLFDRQGWKRLPFGAFADSINERVEPSDAADEIYVGLDDLDPGSLHSVRRADAIHLRHGELPLIRPAAAENEIAAARRATKQEDPLSLDGRGLG